ncbi:MAG TPA: DNA/RNA non-specific endonuclease [Gemmatimonadaceae bacterium]|nr:DNA/RNA non-specific endonuclease [Gemmatimonadaceae bacterium]
MRLHHATGLLAAALALATSCVDVKSTSPGKPAAVSAMPDGPRIASAQLPPVRISEFHYDNALTDVDEKIEISGPAGTSLVGWQIVRYNGNSASRAPYTTPAVTVPLPAAIPATPNCGTRGVAVITFASNGLQNGGSTVTGTDDPDGFALVNDAGVVVEFLSYEGSFVALSGPAAGMTSVDVGVRELGNEPSTPVVTSIKRDGAGVWTGPGTATSPNLSTFGVCNDNDEPPPPQEVDHVTIAPASATVTVGATQQFTASAFDASNNPVAGATFTWTSSEPLTASPDAAGLVSTFLTGSVTITATTPNGKSGAATLQINEVTPPSLPDTRFSEIHYDNSGTDANEAIEIEGPAGTDLAGWSIALYDGTGGTVYNTLALTGTIAARCDGRGVLFFTYPVNGIQNGAPDGLALVNAGGEVVEFLSYEGTFTPAAGPAAGRLSVDLGVLEPGTTSATFSLQRNADGTWIGPLASGFGRCTSEGPAPAPNGITFTGRLATDPPLPVGFEDQIFPTERDGATNQVITTTFTFTSETPDLGTIDANGVMHALAPGTAIFRATAADGVSATFSQAIVVATASTTALYGNNTEFGDPTDSDASDDFIVRRPQYTASYSHVRNTPNWVAYDLDVTHFGSEVDRCDCFTHDPALPPNFAHLTTADYTGAGAFAGFGIDRGHLARSFDRTSAPLDNAFTYYLSNIIPQAADLNQGPWAQMENFLGDLARSQNKEVYIVAGVAGNKGSVKGEGKIIVPAQVWKVAVIVPHDQGLADVHSASDVQIIAVIAPNDPGVRNLDWHVWETTVDAVEALSGYDLLSLLPDQVEIQVESRTQPPSAALDGPYTGSEGSSVAMSGAASTDPDGDALTYAWSFGDGSSGSGASLTHTYAQDGNYSVTLTVTDVRGLSSTVTSSATIGNVAPSVSIGAVGPALLPGETFTGSGSFTDPGADSWSASIDYGDGAPSAALGLGSKTFSLSHTYMAAGSFTVVVRVSDDDVTSSQSTTVTVMSAVQALQIVLDLCPESSLDNKLDAAQKQLAKGNTAAAVDQLRQFLADLDAKVANGRVSASQAATMRAMVLRVIASIS